MENLFKDAKLGDKFKTTEGDYVVFIKSMSYNGPWYVVNNGQTEYIVDYNGHVRTTFYCNVYDIVGRWNDEDDKPNNVFEGAKFGDRYKTRDGRMAIYSSYRKSSINNWYFHYLLVDNENMNPMEFGYNSHGFKGVSEQADDIVGKYNET